LSATPRDHEARRRPVVVTQGDPEGVGPQLVLRLGARRELGPGDVVVADPEVLGGWAARLRTDWAQDGWKAIAPLVHPTRGEGRGASQVAALSRGVDEVLARPERALVTAPIDKHACVNAGFAFAGHTEYLAARAGGVDVAMMLVGPRLKVALATIHVALRDVPARLHEGAIVSVGGLLADAMHRRFSLPSPRIAVLGLNPHAGEGGLLGDEERLVVQPAVLRLRERFPNATFTDPLPADTAFAFAVGGRYDAVLAMYHDQGLGPFKLLHFHDGVNMTLGLPFVRTSPDHGTARDIADAGTADDASMRAAVALAREVAA
jgi:4-hydroxythreonine-4-phosphate dehydrogenase